MSGSSTLLIVGEEVSASALTAAMRAAGSALPRLAWAWARVSRALIWASLSLSSARASSGAISGLTLLCSFCAEARRTAGIGIEQLERGQRIGQFAANPVVDRNRLRIGRHPDRGAGGGIESLVAVDDHRLVAGQIQAVIGHRLEGAHGIRVGGLRQLVDGGDLVAGILGRQLAHLRRIERRLRRQAAGVEQKYKNRFGHEGSVRNLCSAATDYGADLKAGIR